MLDFTEGWTWFAAGLAVSMPRRGDLLRRPGRLRSGAKRSTVSRTAREPSAYGAKMSPPSLSPGPGVGVKDTFSVVSGRTQS